MPHTTLQCGPSGSPGSISFLIQWLEIPVVDIIHVTLSHNQSGTRTEIFCTADHAHHVIPVSFRDIGMQYDLLIQGLTKVVTKYGEFYQVVQSSLTLIDVNPTLWGTSIPLKLVSKVNDLNDDFICKSTLNIGMLQHLTSDGTIYSIHTDKPLDSVHNFFIVLVYDGSKFLFTTTAQTLDYRLPLALQPASHMTIQVYTGRVAQENGGICRIYQVLTASRVFHFRTYTTQAELTTLMGKAISYLTGRGKKLRKMIPIQYLYRNKPFDYWQEIDKKHEGVMKPYKKDFNGDQSSVLNGNIDGLFFSAVLDPSTKLPPLFSFYGPRRLHVSAPMLFQPNFHLYFADFYCHYQVHYVTLVLTPPGVPYDKFCRERLPVLNNFENPFLCLKPDPSGVPCVHVTLGVHIEVLFTECLNVNYVLHKGHGYFSVVAVRGRGYSKMEGIPKNKDCTICNL